MPSSSTTTTTTTTTTLEPTRILALPREIRDEIYKYACALPIPLALYAHHPSHLPRPLTTHPQLEQEALRAFYAVNTFTLSLEPLPHFSATTTSSDISSHNNGTSSSSSSSSSSSTTTPPSPPPQSTHHTTQWHAPNGRLAPLRPHIRHLIVDCTERFSPHPPTTYEALLSSSAERARWTQFLHLPHLASLTIRLQKAHQTSLFTHDFAPIMYALRARVPSVRIDLYVSFDNMLRAVWHDPIWDTLGPPTQSPSSLVQAPPYTEMGYVRATELLDPPSDEDRAYVDEFCAEGRSVPTMVPTMLGLMSESVANRRVLATHYMVKEPALLRLQMKEQYEVFVEAEKKKEACMRS